MPDHALELSFEEASDAACRRQWDALLGAGLPSQAEHRSMTNAPHLTLVAAAPIEAELVEVARALVSPLLPTTLTVRGLVMLGDGPRVTLAHLIEPTAEVARAVADLRGRVVGVRHPVWTPHVTLARRVPRRRVPEALAVLEAHPLRELRADRLRWWDPDQGLVETVAP